MKLILVTGGCGYIGSHTIVDLIENGYDVISIDNNSRSNENMLSGVEKITGKAVKNYKIDLCIYDDVYAVFQENPTIEGIIHFAAYKAVGESVENPMMYFENNINSLINILKCAQELKVPNFVFSSSCTVYGNPDVMQVTEATPQKKAASPYGLTKQIGESIVENIVDKCNTNAVLLRYFNPVGAHLSNAIGELPIGKPQNLIPAITQTAIGKLPQMTVFGADYDTKDGSCIRDFIHVSDIAHAHTLALKFLEGKQDENSCEIFNLGTGDGYSVLEVIKTFEEQNGVKLNYTIGQRREGDVIAIYANNNKAKELLQWTPALTLKDMVTTAWQWELSLQRNN